MLKDPSCNHLNPVEWKSSAATWNDNIPARPDFAFYSLIKSLKRVASPRHYSSVFSPLQPSRLLTFSPLADRKISPGLNGKRRSKGLLKKRIRLNRICLYLFVWWSITFLLLRMCTLSVSRPHPRYSYDNKETITPPSKTYFNERILLKHIK